MTIPFKGRKIVLIGGAGFIGHNLAMELVRRGAAVDIVDSLQVNNLLYFTTTPADAHNRDLYLRILNQRLDLLNKCAVNVHPMDARDYHALNRILDQIKPQVVVHLAAVAHAGKSNKDPYSTFDHSLRTLENTLDWARCSSVEHFIFFSSSMVYGNFMLPEVSEEHPLNSMGIYGALKVAGEKIVVAYNQVFGLPYTIVRPSALYGPRCVSRRVGQIFIESALMGETLRIDGDGMEQLDFTYIDDLVEGVCLVIQNEASRKEIFNMTYGQSRSIQDLLGVVRKYYPSVAIENVERDRLMPMRGTLSIEKARKILGYKPANPIEVGFPKYIEWYRSLYDNA